MRHVLAAFTLALAASVSALGQAGAQTTTDEARKELDSGARAYRARRFAEAEQHFRRALELDPEGKNTRVYIARAVQQQYRPDDTSPENVAAGERAVAEYQDILARDPANEDAYKAVLYLYSQMKNEEKTRETLLSSANNFSFPEGRRAEAFTILASKQWKCSYDVTEQNKMTESKPDKVVVSYKMPADQGDFIRARQCTTEGLQLAEQAVALAPKRPDAWSYKANLLREAAKLAQMEGDEAAQAEYSKQYDEALQTQAGLARGASGAATPDVQAAPAVVVPPDSAAAAKKVVVSGGILNGKAISKPQPAYPPIAKAAGARGTVTVQVVVDEEGNVISARAVSGHPLLQQAAVAAARQAKFSPTLLSGQPVKISGVVTYNFVPEPIVQRENQ
ncbi:MAG: TonB family protein [Acidobacteria bacterium]|nr:TonB family protein [Acidobacteriota bacterium]